jgi:hypothetical protein
VGSANRSDFWVQRRPLLAYWGGPPRPTRHLRARFLKDDYDFASALFFSVQERNYVLALVNFQSPGGDRHPSLDPVRDGEFTARRLRLRLETSGDDRGPFRFQVSAAAFGRYRPSIHSDGVDLLRSEQPVTIRWREIESAYVVFTLAFGGEGGGACEVSAGGGTVTAKWRTPSGVLELTGSTRIAPAAEQNAAFRERIDGKPVPLVRLSDETLDPGI